MWNDSLQTTRIGNSVCRDTNPDLTFTLNVPSAEWSRHPKTLGSDHHILQLTVAHTRKPARLGAAWVTEWKSFRDVLNVETTIENIDDWLKKVLDTAERHTKTIQLNEVVPAVDTHLLHLWEARRTLLKKWKRQKLNKKLKKRIAFVTEPAQAYAETLGRQNWQAFCDKLQGTLSTKTTWHLLRSLLDNDATKTQQRQHLCRLVHNHAGSQKNLLREIEKLCGDPPVNTTAHDKVYDGKPNTDLDQPLTHAELSAVLSTLTRNTSPGTGPIIDKHLRNLPQQATAALLQYFNACWERGELPAAWKHSEITMIPKPKKKLSVKNLRLISLTSQNLSTQDAFLLLKEDLIDHPSTRSKSSILAIDVKGALDNVRHEAILCNLEDLGCGSRTYDNVRNFLTGRTATVGIYNLRSDSFRLPSKGTPQGSVISLLLFNVKDTLSMPAISRYGRGPQTLEHKKHAYRKQ
ncbi:uncharacterized protein LOC142557953 [Dermacentor variabilis]|uniref:uncharacterized protein LOC142557953 n=1 Tax=Dermacentor variabilis TaxID=34621 RepID=UPI003F5C22F0